MGELITKFGRGMGVLCLVLVLLNAAVVWAEANDVPKKDAEKKEVLTAVEERMKQVVSVDFRETPIDDVLRALSKQAGIDIVKSPQVSGNVTATLTDIPLGEALNNILSAHGYAYIATENMIRVVPRKDIIEIQEKTENKIYRIKFADVAQVEKMLKNFLGKEGGVSMNAGTSTLIVSAAESKIKAIDSFIKEIDRETPQLLIEARIYDITSSDALDLGVQWQIGKNTSYEEGVNKNIGGKAGVPGITGKKNPFTTGMFSAPTNNTSATDGLIRFGFLTGSVNIDAMLRAEQQDTRAKLLANPRILVLDNETATFKAMREIPYQQLTQTGGVAGGGAIGTTEFKEVGVELKVIPHLTENDLIRLHIMPKFSVKVDEVSISIIGIGDTALLSPQPVVDTREADSIILIKDGQTVVIGGLRKQEVVQAKNKIPLLGDMPVAGALFRFEGEETINSELVVFITPHVVKTQVLTPAEQAQLEQTEVPAPKSPDTRLGKGAE